MRTLPFDVLVATALLIWALRRQHSAKGLQRFVAGTGILVALFTLPRVIWGWQVQQHLPLGYLHIELAVAALWLASTLAIATGLLTSQLLVRSPVETGPDASRRRFLSRAPIVLGLVGPPGVAGAMEEPQLRPVRIGCPGLPTAFDGLRILQISDLHLGPYLGLDWLERALERDSRVPVDMVAVTGDLSDDLALMAPALERIARVPAPLGHWVIPGNHEHYVGIEPFLRAVKASPCELLLDRAITLRRGEQTLQLLGIDYPFRPFVRGRRQMAQMLDRALSQSAPGFKLLLAHHPDAFDEAVPRGIDVVLSGHTHGGQVAPLGISLYGLVARYSRGLYTQGASRLWVTTGLGHWMPYRIECPVELPVIELVREG